MRHAAKLGSAADGALSVLLAGALALGGALSAAIHRLDEAGLLAVHALAVGTAHEGRSARRASG